MGSNRQRIGLIIAAGRGRRMGRTKQLVPWATAGDERPLVAAAYDAIAGVCDAMVVVLGHEADAVAAALGDRPFQRTQSDPDGPMFASIRAGLLACRAIDGEATIVMQPGDHPEVSPTTLERLIAAAGEHASVAVIPEFDGRGGHPVFIPPAIFTEILAAGCPQGLGRFWQTRPELCIRLPVDDANVTMDVDTAAQLRRTYAP
jgi:molybdenum cofactor cytidylyltransferase